MDDKSGDDDTSVVFVGGWGTRPGHWNSGSLLLEFSFVSQGGMVNIPLTGTGKLLSGHSAVQQQFSV